MNLTQSYETFEKPGLVVAYKQSNVKIYKGAMVALNVNGYAVPLDHTTASLKFVGIANETIDNSPNAPSDKSINITKCGSFVFKAASGFNPDRVDIGREAYANSDWEVQTSCGLLAYPYKVGTIQALEITSTGAIGVRVRIDNHTV